MEGIYRSGGNASALLAQFNAALQQIDEARTYDTVGQAAKAQVLRDQARAALEMIISETPAAQQEAQVEQMHRSIFIISLVPITVISSSIFCYLVIRGWRRYERSQLYEMRIVEDKGN